MNCHDIASLLDDGDPGRLDAPLQQQVAAHLAACMDCRMDWEAQAGLQQLPDLPMRAAFPAACRAAVAESSRPGRARHITRGYLAGAALVAVAAAAALVATGWGPSTEPAVDPLAGVTAQAPAAGNEVNAAPVAPVQTPVTTAVTAGAEAAPVTTASARTLRIGVLPLKNEGNDAAGQTAIEGFYAAILDGLRQRQDVQVISVASREAAEREVQFLLDVAGYTTGKGLRGAVRATRLGDHPLTLPIAGEFAASCEPPAGGQVPQCLDGTALAGSMLDMLRSMLLPPVPSERQALVARVGDSAATPDQRLMALRELAVPRSSDPGSSPQRLERPADLADPALLRGAVDLAAVGSAAQRAEVWRTLRSVGATALIDPLIQSARLDVDAKVRMEAVATLGAGFSSDPRVRSELEIVATQDSRPLVRALAQRALQGESAWRDYITAALKDDNLPAEQRLEPLFHHLNEGSEGLGELLDDAAIRGFGVALAEARGTPLAARISTVVFSRAAEVKSAVMTDLLLSAFREGSGFNRMLYLNQLIRRPRDPRIEALLQDVSINDADLQLRRIAADALAAGVAAPPTAD